MSKKEFEEFEEIMRKHREEVTSSKEAARKFLTKYGFLTPTGKLKKKFRTAN